MHDETRPSLPCSDPGAGGAASVASLGGVPPQPASGAGALDRVAVRAFLAGVAAHAYPNPFARTYYVISRDRAAKGDERGVRAFSYRDLDDAAPPRALEDAVEKAASENALGRDLYTFHQPVFFGGRLWARDKHRRRFPLGHGQQGNPPMADDVDSLAAIPIDIDPQDTVDSSVAALTRCSCSTRSRRGASRSRT